jgi:hypothetical protein
MERRRDELLTVHLTRGPIDGRKSAAIHSMGSFHMYGIILRGRTRTTKKSVDIVCPYDRVGKISCRWSECLSAKILAILYTDRLPALGYSYIYRTKMSIARQNTGGAVREDSDDSVR